MGRLFLEYVTDDDVAAKYTCKCGADTASESGLLWEGFMGACTPALLFRNAVNIEPCGSERQEVLSTGRYTLLDVQCRCCRVPIGWRYITADSPDQRYKEGAYLLQQGALKRVGCGERSSGSGLSSPGLSSPGLSSPGSGGSPTSGSPLRAAHRLAPPRALAQLARLRE
ncbi:yippee-like protein [Chlorella sorokiniana]|jgi:hypothetical protein|uniref:Yippee-like protein n=1 Tax=Chlorella sorokiniana TaxID=3076 RepID=A0A2P6TYP5_CHLSO|nr:yippee-like protein [Chlorella sorokiniana]|eukprot:PRW59182.1 yippee-like protein [Chlorella sorokiniana]